MIQNPSAFEERAGARALLACSDFSFDFSDPKFLRPVDVVHVLLVDQRKYFRVPPLIDQQPRDRRIHLIGGFWVIIILLYGREPAEAGHEGFCDQIGSQNRFHRPTVLYSSETLNDFRFWCRRPYKSGIVAGTKADGDLQRKSSENGWPNGGGRVFDDPELE